MTTMDWRFKHRTILKLVGLPVLCGLLAAAAVLDYDWFHPLSEQQRQRVDPLRDQLLHPVFDEPVDLPQQ